MTWIVVLWPCSLGQPLCTHPDATWSGREYEYRSIATLNSDEELYDFERANPERQVIKFEVMPLDRWRFERGSYHCGRSGGDE